MKKFDEPTLIIHGDDDQIVPIGAWAHEAAKNRDVRSLRLRDDG